MNCYTRLHFSWIVLVLYSSAYAQQPIEYNEHIRPILAEHCFACHGTDSGSRQADLRLDQRDAAIEFGAIQPGDADSSELIARVFTDDPDLLMPPPETKKSLTAEQKNLLRAWVASGAEYQPHWSFLPVDKPPLPQVTIESRVRNPIDRFIFARLEREGLTPAAEADPRTLIRRLHYDILGLPPKPADVVAFVAEYDQRKDLALSEWIDRLMESTAWGEHRARYWLDAARYADTHGLHFDNYREMWPYRDWVIRAFNTNQPFDQFTIEQLAGDLLPNPDTNQLIATGFQRCNVTTNEGGTIVEENLALYAADRVQTFGWVFLGLTTNCAQCHDHKFDPFSIRDYYSLAAFFRNTDAPAKDGNTKDGKGPTIVIPAEADRDRWHQLPAELAAAISKRDDRAMLSQAELERWLTTATTGAAPDISSDGLLIHLPLNEGKGRVVQNLAVGGISHQATGPIKWQKGGVIGPAPKLQKNSTFELGEIADFERDQTFSCGAWVKITKQAVNKGTHAAIIARMDVKDQYRGWDLWQAGTALSVHLIDSWTGNAIKVSTSPGTISPNRWHHVFATHDGSGKPDGIKIYVDGESIQIKTDQNTLRKDASIRTATPLRIGQRSNGAVFAGGLVQDVRIYERLLTAEEVIQLVTLPPVRFALEKAPQDRTDNDRQRLQDYYLSQHDPAYSELAKAVTMLEDEKRKIVARSPVTHVQREKQNSTPMANLLMRGAYDRPGESLPAATPEALHPMPTGAPLNRLGLARWVTDDSNPLTARVTVNRFWQEVFGQGLVSTAEDFGVSGAQPTHPELLDWLAHDFVESDWNVQRFFKQVFMSATYRQVAQTTPEKLESDPGNALLSRGPRFRMDAEMVRDTALAVSGLLSPRMYGPGTKPYQPENIWEIVGLPGGDTRIYKQDKGENLYRRTIYNFWKRMAPSPNMEAFNAPSREVCTVRRERTNTPLQALVTLNDPQFVESARLLATHALNTSSGDDGMTLDFIAERLLARPLSTDEQAIVQAAQRDYLKYYRRNTEAATSLIAVGDSEVDEALDPVTLATWTMVCNQLMNLDEVLNK